MNKKLLISVIGLCFFATGYADIMTARCPTVAELSNIPQNSIIPVYDAISNQPIPGTSLGTNDVPQKTLFVSAQIEIDSVSNKNELQCVYNGHELPLVDNDKFEVTTTGTNWQHLGSLYLCGNPPASGFDPKNCTFNMQYIPTTSYIK